MKVHCNNMIAAGHDEHVGNEFGRNRGSRLVFSVHTCIKKARNNSRNPPGGSCFAGRDEDKKLHQVIVHIIAG